MPEQSEIKLRASGSRSEPATGVRDWEETDTGGGESDSSVFFNIVSSPGWKPGITFVCFVDFLLDDSLDVNVDES